ncbi:MAG: alpha/beta hydrolase [Roseinatronobacter sp.]
MIDWEDAFQNGAYIAGAEGYPETWAARAAAFRAGVQGECDLAYCAHPRARLDLFRPEGAVRGLVVFVHGGYWLKFDKSIWSHLAAGPLARGWAVALPSYTLAPEVSIPEITAQIGAAVGHAAGLVAGPIRLAGHSAGGHLVTRMICDDSTLAFATRARVAQVVSISGLHDLRPLLATGMNDQLRLTPETAAAESPVLHAPLPGIPVTAWVGGDERPEFLRQSALLREAWAADLEVAKGRHHFDVIDDLAKPDSALTEALLSD